MHLRRLDDYQSWQVVVGSGSVLIDPWLTPEPISGSFDRQHTTGFTTLEQARTGPDSASVEISGVLLCTGVNGHARPATLALLDEVPVFGPRSAASVDGCGSNHTGPSSLPHAQSPPSMSRCCRSSR